MKSKIIGSLKLGILKARVLKAFLGAALVYLISYIILMLITLPTVSISLAISVLFFISEMVVLYKDDALLQVEEKYEELNEELRTMSDTMDKDNELAKGLREEVSRKVHRLVDIGDFLDFRNILSRTLFIFFLSFSIVLLASLNIRVVDSASVIDFTKDFSKNLLDNTIKEGREQITVVNGDSLFKSKFTKLAATAGLSAGEQDGSEIFGESEVVQLGQDRINIEIKPTDFEVSVDDYTPPEKKEFQEIAFQDEVGSGESQAFQERIPQEKQALVKRYFQQLAEN